MDELEKKLKKIQSINRRLGKQLHESHAEELSNAEKIQNTDRVVFHLSRRQHATDQIVTKLNRDKEKTEDGEDEYDYTK